FIYCHNSTSNLQTTNLLFILLTFHLPLFEICYMGDLLIINLLIHLQPLLKAENYPLDIYYLIPYTSFTPTPTYSLPSDSTASFITSSLNNSIFNTFPPSFEKVLIISFVTSKDVLYLSSVSKYSPLKNLPSCK